MTLGHMFSLFSITTAISIATLTANASNLNNSVNQLPFARPQQMIDIGGRKLNLYCSGSGSTTVVFDAPSGDSSWAWFAVQPEVAKHTRACVYDRAGLGFSEPSPMQGTSTNAINDLHALLSKAGIAPPYLMVGNSYGGANVQLYAYRYPDEVKGLVLVEPHHEDATARLSKVSDGKTALFEASMKELQQTCLNQSSKGFVSGSQEWAMCIGAISPQFQRELAAAHIAVEISASYWQAAFSENTHFEEGDKELRSARRSFGAIPVHVLTRGISPFAIPGKAPSALNIAVEKENRAMNKEVAALSSQGSERVIKGTGHNIQADSPKAVVDAVLEVLAKIK